MHDSSQPEPTHADVRMRGFPRRQTVEEALAWLDVQIVPLGAEDVPLAAAAGRVLAADVVSEVAVPSFDRAMMDGYAVRAENVAGASSYNRLRLAVIGEAFPGRPHRGSVASGEAVRIMTGAAMPAGADAVLPAEWIEATGPLQIEALADVSPYKHVGRIGEDVMPGTVVLRSGRRLRPQDVGLLSSIGRGMVSVRRAPRVQLLITGNELTAAGGSPPAGHIADSNGPMLAALVERDGGELLPWQIVSDSRDALRTALLAEADVVVTSGGSSVGLEDLVPVLVSELGELAVHGVAMRPSSPSGLGRIGSRLVCLLPGNPVSCLAAYDFFAGRAIRALGGRRIRWPYRSERRKLVRKIASVIGRLDYVRVCLREEGAEPVAVSGAAVLSSTTVGDGFVLVPADCEGFPAGAEVEVWLYDLDP